MHISIALVAQRLSSKEFQITSIEIRLAMLNYLNLTAGKSEYVYVRILNILITHSNYDVINWSHTKFNFYEISSMVQNF